MALPIAAGLVAAAYLDGKFQLSRDIKVLLKLKAAERDYQKRVKDNTVSPWCVFADTVRRQPQDRAIWTRERLWTYQELHADAVQQAQWMIEQGIKPGDLVALYLLNSGEQLSLILAMYCIGASPAMINYNLEGKALMHCLSVCETKLLIADSDAACQQRLSGSVAEIEAAGAKIVTLDNGLREQVKLKPLTVPGHEWRKDVKGADPWALIYTSGTTGLPKGCAFTIARTWLTGSQLEPAFGAIRGQDCWYSPMPLYHGTGLMTTSISLVTGVGVAVAPRFSVSSFWPDIYDSRSTMFIYVGETARYLLAAPPHPLERKHSLKLAYGNGLRPDVWHQFQERFNVPEVAEFFNSTEGMFTLVVWARNRYTTRCVGHHGLVIRALLNKIYIPVRVDYETGDIWRDPTTGFAQRVPYAEGGEILVTVPNKEAFQGYWRNQEATDKRFALNVFQEGDIYYRAGDALRRDPDGHWYFMDRLGDTFRWKSENVSTAEVSQALGKHPKIAEANVFGVLVPGHEGRAGCAAIDVRGSDQMDYADLLSYARTQLPRYAVPVFLRVVKRSSHIHNHKQNKVGLRKEGVDPGKIGTEEKDGVDDVFLWWRPGTDGYVPFERKDWDSLEKGEVRL